MKLRKTLAGILGAVVMLLGVGTFEHVNREIGVKAADYTSKSTDVLVEDYASSNNWNNQTRYQSMILDGNITATVSDGSNTGKYYTSDHSWRLYQNESGKITITATNDCLIDYVTFTFTVKDSGKLNQDSTSITSGSKVDAKDVSTITFEAGSSSGSKGKVFITNIKVEYLVPTNESEEPHVCVYDQEKVLTKYLCDEATCTSAATYFYSCACGEKGNETFSSGNPLGHDYDELGFCKRCPEFNTESSYDESISTLFDIYYNEGSYIKETYLNVNSTAMEEVGIYFHAEAVAPYRKTVYEPGKLSMVTANVEGEYDNETLSVYEDNGENVKHTGLGGNWTVNWTSVEDKFVTLKDFKESTITGWTYENGIYSFKLAETTATFEDNMTRMAREFVAPMWLAPNADNYSYLRFAKLTVEEDGAELVMKLFVNSGDASKLIDQSEYLFSQARISKGTTNLATLATFELGTNGGGTTESTQSKETYTETVNGYTLTLTGGSKMYPNSYDAKGNGTIKMGSSSAIGQFTFTVPQDVNKVVINVAGRTKPIDIDINGSKYSISTLATNGEYTAIEIDTTSTKTITFKTENTDNEYRCMINSIEYHA